MKTLNPLQSRILLAGLALAACTLPVQAQDWPVKPIKLVSPSTSGGPPDMYARALADVMSRELGQPMVVENAPAVGGMVGAQTVKRADPDGYTLFIGTAGALTITPNVNRRANYTAADFTPICQGVEVGLTLVGHPGLGIKDYKGLQTWIKAQNPPPSYSSFGPGSPPHFLGFQLGDALGVNMVHVPYRSTPLQLQDMLGGVTPLGFVQTSNATPQIQAGKLTAYAVTSPQRVPELPDVPTVKEVGLPELETTVWFGLTGPKGLPPAVSERLIAAHRKVLASPEFRTRMGAAGLTPSADTCGPAFARKMEADTARWAKVVKDSGFEPEK